MKQINVDEIVVPPRGENENAISYIARIAEANGIDPFEDDPKPKPPSADAQKQAIASVFATNERTAPKPVEGWARTTDEEILRADQHAKMHAALPPAVKQQVAEGIKNIKPKEDYVPTDEDLSWMEP